MSASAAAATTGKCSGCSSMKRSFEAGSNCSAGRPVSSTRRHVPASPALAAVHKMASSTPGRTISASVPAWRASARTGHIMTGSSAKAMFGGLHKTHRVSQNARTASAGAWTAPRRQSPVTSIAVAKDSPSTLITARP
jgi:hypothetical protein